MELLPVVSRVLLLTEMDELELGLGSDLGSVDMASEYDGGGLGCPGSLLGSLDDLPDLGICISEISVSSTALRIALTSSLGSPPEFRSLRKSLYMPWLVNTTSVEDSLRVSSLSMPASRSRKADLSLSISSESILARWAWDLEFCLL